jgi:hypothetical protein
MMTLSISMYPRIVPSWILAFETWHPLEPQDGYRETEHLLYGRECRALSMSFFARMFLMAV